MINKCLALFLCFGLIGCASELSQKYSTIYDNALNAEGITIIAKNESYQQFKQELSRYLTLFGYTRLIFVDPKQGLMVVAKEGDAYPFRIILKYTATTGPFNIRVDLANGSDDLSNNTEVSKDIEELAELIRN